MNFQERKNELIASGHWFQKSGYITHVQGKPLHKGTEWGHEDAGNFRGNRHELVFPNLIPMQERAARNLKHELENLAAEVANMQKFLWASGVDVNKAVNAFEISQGNKKALANFHLLRELEQKKSKLKELQQFAADVAAGWGMP